MKILLDECIPVRLKQHLTAYEVRTVSEMGWTSLKNGKLMKVAIESGFEVMLTVDKNLQHQQNLNEYEIAIVVLDVHFNRLQDFIPLIPKFIEIYPKLIKKKTYIIK
jgi:predicted nuclease of predicted toxin-antitoxin system